MSSSAPFYSLSAEMGSRSQSGVDDWDLVIKVKYGDTLRRFGAHVHGRSMDHNISSLRMKIINLFKLSPEADLILSYTDEDGESVALDEDEELHDAAISQRLNPLRINVQLKTSGSSDPKSQEASSTPTQQIETTPLRFTDIVGEALTSIPEPLRELSNNLAMKAAWKAASSTPAIAECIEYLSKVGLLDVSLPSHGGSSAASNGHTNLANVNTGDGLKAAIDPVQETAVSASASSSNPDSVHIPKQKEGVNMTQGSRETPTSVDITLDPPRNQHASEFPSLNDLWSCAMTTKLSGELGKEGADVPGGKSTATTFLNPENQAVVHNSRNCVAFNPFFNPHNTVGAAELSGVESNKLFPTTTVPMHPIPITVPHTREAPFSTPYMMTPHNHHATFHRGVQCDGCGMYPITGPRFKSNVKEDYDLCNFCFLEMGNEAEYTRIERSPNQSTSLFKQLYHPHLEYGNPSSRPIRGREMRRPFGGRPECSSRAKLDSCFIDDVTVTDGTLMPPCTPFTKIWRMRNSGTVSWPFGTKLVWTGGNRLGTRGTATLVISVNGCPVDEKMDIAIDFTSPSKPGSYISYWRLATAHGRTFGQRVWVQIEVENIQRNAAIGGPRHDFNLNLHPESSVNVNPSSILEPATSDCFVGANDSPLTHLNLNLHPEGNELSGLGSIDMNLKPLDVVCDETNFTNVEPESSVNVNPSTTLEPAMSDCLVGANKSHVKLVPDVTTSVSQPVFHSQESVSKAIAVANMPLSEGATDDNSVEQTLLKELEEMGFRQIDLNKEVLKLNEYNLEQSVDDLCGFAEWDPLLAELEEMGFNNKELNRKLLAKNDGSIKRAVLDLISGERHD